jgi:hypothetical protein
LSTNADKKKNATRIEQKLMADKIENDGQAIKTDKPENDGQAIKADKPEMLYQKSVEAQLTQQEVEETYAKASKLDTPDFWSRIEQKLDNEKSTAYDNKKSTTYVKKHSSRQIWPIFAVAAVLVAVVIVGAVCGDIDRIRLRNNSFVTQTAEDEKTKEDSAEYADSDDMESVADEAVSESYPDLDEEESENDETAADSYADSEDMDSVAGAADLDATADLDADSYNESDESESAKGVSTSEDYAGDSMTSNSVSLEASEDVDIAGRYVRLTVISVSLRADGRKQLYCQLEDGEKINVVLSENGENATEEISEGDVLEGEINDYDSTNSCWEFVAE